MPCFKNSHAQIVSPRLPGSSLPLPQLQMCWDYYQEIPYILVWGKPKGGDAT